MKSFCSHGRCQFCGDYVKLGLKLMSHRLCCFNKNKLTIQSFRWINIEEEKIIKDNVFFKVIKVFESTILKFWNPFHFSTVFQFQFEQRELNLQENFDVYPFPNMNLTIFHFPHLYNTVLIKYSELKFVKKRKEIFRRHFNARCPSRNQPMYQWPKNRGDPKFICGGTDCKV